jgi:hypothetical protein
VGTLNDSSLQQGLSVKGVDMTEWISVKDRLPEGDGFVLIHYSKEYTDKDPNWVWCDGTSRTYVAVLWEGDWWDCDKLNVICDPTHWMPLPQPPKGE